MEPFLKMIDKNVIIFNVFFLPIRIFPNNKSFFLSIRNLLEEAFRLKLKFFIFLQIKIFETFNLLLFKSQSCKRINLLQSKEFSKLLE